METLKLDLVKILQDCPKGMPLDCEIFDGTVTFSRIVNDEQYPIEIKIDDDYKEYLNKYGGYVDRSFCKCVIFPKGKTSWEGFQKPFVDGDIVFYNDTVAIFKEWGDETLFRTYVAKGLNCEDLIGINTPLFGKSIRKEIRFATEKEKEQLFQAIKDHGYKWNVKTKTLETLIVPKFKVGDIIRHQRDLSKPKNIITEIRDIDYVLDNEMSLPFTCQESYELVPNKFDPKTLQPFDKVLVSCNDEWFCDFFSHYDDAVNKFNCTCTGGCPYEYCIPYNDDTKHLIGKTIEDAPEFYRYWEE